MKFPPLTVIEASAGTGKTFSLVTRLLQLIFSGTEPERIVALTFSRMAAGEIFNSFIERLSNAAAGDTAAREESERLGRPLSAGDFAAMLRKVISRQHLSLIGTLDSFLMKVVRMMPLELGLEGEISVMSEYRTPVERVRLVGDMLMLQSDDAKAVFLDAFSLAFGNSGAKCFLERFSDFIEKWHSLYRDCESATAWGQKTAIWGDNAPDGLDDVTLSGVRAMADALESLSGVRGAEKFIAAVREFSGQMPAFGKTIAKEEAFCRAYRMMALWRILNELKRTQGIYRLMRTYEAVYAEKVRRRGLITFDDVPRLLNSLSSGVRLPLEYRMDARFDHWALDEFQDTSRSQWAALENLINESSHPDSGKSVFIVGDRKQSIYDWRGGDVRILGEQVAKAKGDATNRLASLDESRRYVNVISESVNKVFLEDTVRGLFDMDDAPESAIWKCRPHVSHDRTSNGFVEVIEAVKHRSVASISDFLEPIENALNAVRPWERGISTAILVRKNDIGETILAHLKSRGISNVVFEGDSNVNDSPVLAAMTELVKLAEHADDTFSYAHIRHSPLSAALHPDGLPDAATLSAQLLSDFTRLGMVRKFRDVREALKAIPGTWNGFTESRFEDFIKCVAEFESIRDASMRLSDFIEYLSHKRRRDFAEPGMVRIMTMHQSKGLGFDHVIIPFYEPEKLIGERHIGPLTGERQTWILSNPGSAIDGQDEVLAAAERRRQQVQRYNALCLYYVAMTRAKRALTVILHPGNAKPPASPERFSDLVRSVGLATSGVRDWYLDFKKDNDQDNGNPANQKNADPEKPKMVRRPRQTTVKSRPSELFHSGLRGDRLFNDDFGASAKRGIDIHAAYQAIEWATDGELAAMPPAFREAFAKTSGDVTVWRERGYELFDGGRWESGQFDRVVFSGDGDCRRAVIYDFKTNRKRLGESDADFVERMKTAYAFQMSSYRAALSRLTGLSPKAITAKLLLHSTGAVVEVA